MVVNKYIRYRINNNKVVIETIGKCPRMKPSRKVDTEPPKEAVIQWLYYTGGEGMSMVTVGMLADGWLHGIYIRQLAVQVTRPSGDSSPRHS